MGECGHFRLVIIAPRGWLVEMTKAKDSRRKKHSSSGPSPGSEQRKRSQAERRTSQISAAEFKARCLELMDRVQQERRSIVVTKHGKPVVRVIPYEAEAPSIVGWAKGSVTYYGDIISPVDVVWEADAGEDRNAPA
jgi:prevent-host-death family protein